MIFIYNTTELFVDITKIFKKTIKNSIITTKFHGHEHYYLIVNGIDYYDEFPTNYDVYQFEQMENFIFQIPESENRYLALLRGANKVYDFSNLNIKILQEKYNLTNLYYWPLFQKGYEIYNFNKKQFKYNVVFIGRKNKRRTDFLDSLSMPVEIFDNVDNDSKTKILKLSKIALNIHYYDKAVLEVERIIECLKNKCLVISEYSADDELNNYYKSMIIFVNNKEELNDKINYYLTNDKERELLIAQFYNEFLSVEMKNLFGPITENKIISEISDSFPKNRKKYNYAQLKKINNEYMIVFNKNLSLMDMPPVSLVTITKNRNKFIPLMVNNYINFKYPYEKIEWIILDDGDTYGEYFNALTKKYKNIKYFYDKTPKTIENKRNAAVALATHDIICHMDDDDYYFPNSLYMKVKLLLDSKDYKCVGSNELAIYNTVNNNSYISNFKICGEATFCYYKKWWEECNFKYSLNGEGYNFTYGREDEICIIPYYFNLIVLNHKENYTGKKRQCETVESNNLYSLFDRKTKDILHDILKVGT